MTPANVPLIRTSRSPDLPGQRAGSRALAAGLPACTLVALLLASLLWHGHRNSVAVARAGITDLARQQQHANDDLIRTARDLGATMAAILARNPAADTGLLWQQLRPLLTGRSQIAGLSLVTIDGLPGRLSQGSAAPSSAR